MANGSLRVIRGCPPGKVKPLTMKDMRKFKYVRMESLVVALNEIETWAAAVREMLQAFAGNDHIELKQGKPVPMKAVPRAATSGTGVAREKPARRKATVRKTARRKRRKTRG